MDLWSGFSTQLHTIAFTMEPIGDGDDNADQASQSLILICSCRYCLDKNYAGVLIIWDRYCVIINVEKKTE